MIEPCCGNLLAEASPTPQPAIIFRTRRAGRRVSTAALQMTIAWVPLLILVSAAAWLTSETPPWQRMLALCWALLAGLKWLSWQGSSHRRGKVARWRSLAYLLAWPGMDARAFLDPQQRPARPAAGEWLLAAGQTLVGVVLVWVGARRAIAISPVLAGWIGLAGLLALFHFGLLHLLSLFWRSVGIEAQPLMDRPWAARTLSEFWGRRWNRAFRQSAFDFVYRPCVRPLGTVAALAAVFAFSALVHELAISVPACGGYGLPSIYFALQAAGIAAARSAGGRRLGLDGAPCGRWFAWLVVVGPAPLLFHEPFLDRVILPLLAAVGAL